MLVQQILQSKGNSSVMTASAATSLTDAAKILAENKIGTVVVSDDGKTALGILSERDIVRVLAKHGAEIMCDSVDKHMTTSLVTCTSKMSAHDVLEKMTAGRFRHMPVVEDGVLLGLVTLGDVVKSQLSQLAMEKKALEDMVMGF